MPAPDLNAAALPDSDALDLSPETPGQEWWHVFIRFADWATAEQISTARLAPLLNAATQPDGAWWFIRKHPDWRIRIQAPADQRPHLKARFDQLVDEGVLTRWQTGRYEPETSAFGGPDAMTAAHTLFAADSHALLHPPPLPIGRRELSMLFLGVLVRGAGLEPYEIGDVWAKVARDRPLPADITDGKLAALTTTITTLLRTDLHPHGAAFGPTGPLAAATHHAEAFRTCGQALARLAREGRLERGLRTVLAYHVIFHWNRAGFEARQQSLLAHAARAAILGPTPQTPPQPATRRPSTDHPSGQVERALRAFPLVPRPRLTCPALFQRLQAVAEHAAAAAASCEPEERVDRACSAWNLAALIASDTGLPGLAADLSWQQFRILHAHGPLLGRYAIAALQPLVNLARLHGRASQPERMYRALTDLEHALQHGGSFLLHDTLLTLDGLSTAEDPELHAWYQDVLAQDGTRALAATGNWNAAAAHAALYDPHPDRLHEGTQTRVIALTLAGNHEAALAHLDQRPPSNRTEQAVDAALRAHLAIRTGRTPHDEITQLLASIHDDSQLAEQTDLVPLLCRIRLTQAASDLGASPTSTKTLWRQITDATLRTGDAYAAHQASRSPSCAKSIAPEQAAALTDLTRRAGLPLRDQPISVLPDLAMLAAALQQAVDVLTCTLQRSE
ncbi:thiopeptide-type bacteriocin biosynthesis protein [Actinocorallia libanotica]|uniref:Thiopeptide-type bacteriocin biosynthesis domain-containing protein n=1 Tax=Actinocorallia libanotica TaxID=46162 RepID=A0ABN1REW8_9ACTN